MDRQRFDVDPIRLCILIRVFFHTDPDPDTDPSLKLAQLMTDKFRINLT